MCNSVWRDGSWHREAFGDVALESYIKSAISGRKETLHKVFTNYRHMLRIAGIVAPDLQIGSVPFHAGDWALQACKLMWDRAIYSGNLDELASEADLVAFFMNNEGHKLLGTTAGQAKTIATFAAAEYVVDGGTSRFAAFV